MTKKNNNNHDLEEGKKNERKHPIYRRNLFRLSAQRISNKQIKLFVHKRMTEKFE